MRSELNPPGVQAEMLAGLNRAFPEWGGAREYRWFFGRTVGGPPPDLLVRSGTTGIVAAIGLNYRQVDLGDGDSVLAGIITSAWTAIEARQSGHFGILIRDAFLQVHARGGRLVLGFVTEENPSCQAMVRAGCELVPTWYLVSTEATRRPATGTRCRDVEATADRLANLAEEASRRRAGHLHFRYDLDAEWTSQFLHRPHPVTVLCLGEGDLALVERTPRADRVQLLLAQDPESALRALLVRALDANRQLFLFTANQELADTAGRLGLGSKPGRLTVGALRSDPRFAGPWYLDSGDRM